VFVAPVPCEEIDVVPALVGVEVSLDEPSAFDDDDSQDMLPIVKQATTTDCQENSKFRIIRSKFKIGKTPERQSSLHPKV
jgi:hypothetical protein